MQTTPPSEILIRLDFPSHREPNAAEFTFVLAGDSTRVTWTMSGPNSYMAKVMGVFAGMDRMIGESFETGLANVKRIVEGSAS